MLGGDTNPKIQGPFSINPDPSVTDYDSCIESCRAKFIKMCEDGYDGSNRGMMQALRRCKNRCTELFGGDGGGGGTPQQINSGGTIKKAA